MAQSMDEFVEGLRTSVAGWKADVARFEAQEAEELAALVSRWIAEAEKLIATYEKPECLKEPKAGDSIGAGPGITRQAIAKSRL